MLAPLLAVGSDARLPASCILLTMRYRLALAASPIAAVFPGRLCRRRACFSSGPVGGARVASPARRSGTGISATYGDGAGSSVDSSYGDVAGNRGREAGPVVLGADNALGGGATIARVSIRHDPGRVYQHAPFQRQRACLVRAPFTAAKVGNAAKIS